MKESNEMNDFTEYKQKSEEARQNINSEIYDKILDSAKFFLKKRQTNLVSDQIVSALDNMEEASKILNLNAITDIYLFESEFGLNSRDLTEEFLYITLIMITNHYKDENMNYIEEIILNDNKFRGENALQFYLKIGTSHKERREYVLNFIENNIDKFSEGHKNMVAMFIKTFLKGDRKAKEIFDNLNINDPEIHFRNHNNSAPLSDKPTKTTYTKKNPKWWEIWK